MNNQLSDNLSNKRRMNSVVAFFILDMNGNDLLIDDPETFDDDDSDSFKKDEPEVFCDDSEMFDNLLDLFSGPSNILKQLIRTSLCFKPAIS